MSTNFGLGASVTGTLDSSVTTVAGVSFVSVCSSGLSVTKVYLYRLTLKFCSGNRMGEGWVERPGLLLRLPRLLLCFDE